MRGLVMVKHSRVRGGGQLYQLPVRYYKRWEGKEACSTKWRLAGDSSYRPFPDNWRI